MTESEAKLFSPAEYRRRYLLVESLLADADLDALLVYANSYANGGIRWLTGFAARHDSYLLCPRRGEPALLTQLFNHVPNAQRVAAIDEVRWAGPNSGETVLALIKERGLDRAQLGLAGRLPYHDYLKLVNGLPSATLANAGREFMNLRLVKSEEELSVLHRGAVYTDQAMEALLMACQVGASEYELAAAVEAAYTADGGEHGIHFLSSTPMEAPVVFVPGQTQTARLLRGGDVVISELSAGVGGYAGQIHRPIAIGREPTALYQRLYDVALRAYQDILAVLRPGATVGDALDAAEVIARSGLTVCDDLLHGYGQGYLAPVVRTRQTSHGQGPAEDFEFQENMAIVVQPNVIDPESGAGLQVGNLLHITDRGAESLQHFPIDFFVRGS